MLPDLQTLAALSGREQPTLMDRSARRNLKKALDTTAGFVGLELRDYAKLMLPFYAGLTNRFPTTTPERGAATAQWRAQLGFGSQNFGDPTVFGTAEAATGPDESESATSFAAPYKELSRKGDVTRLAMNQARGFDDAMGISSIYNLSAIMRSQEYINFFANNAAITMTTPTVAASTIHAGPTFANGTWHLRITAITGQGSLMNAAANSNVGESAVATVTIASGASGCDFFDVLIPYVPGAAGYKVYVESAAGSGTYYLANPNTDLVYAKADSSGNYNTTAGDAIVVPTNQTYVTVTRLQVKAIPANTQPNPPVADGSANANVFEGIWAWCTKSVIYGVTLPFRNVIDMKGLPLTSTARGVKEFDSILATQWNTNHNAPSLIVTSSNGVDSLSNKLASAGGNNQVRLEVYQERNGVVGGLYYGGYIARYASQQAGIQKTIEVWAHPYCPDGTFLFISENVPTTTVPYSRVGKTFERSVQQPYEYFPLGPVRRSIPYTISYAETLLCYWPDVQSAIVGCRMDS